MQAFSITIAPRFYETDAMGHINNTAIAAWLETARVRFIESLADGALVDERSWILASVKIDYLSETFYGEEVIATVTDASPGNSSLTLQLEMVQGGRRTVRATAVLVYMNFAQKTPERVPDQIRERLARA
ncbi:MAG: thioesterase family protein [Halioglobus sp.]